MFVSLLLVCINYPTPFMFMNEVSLHAFLLWNRFVDSPKSILTCARCFVASVETIEFWNFSIVVITIPLNTSQETIDKDTNVFFEGKTGVAPELDIQKS